MLTQQLALSPDIQQLVDEGYNVDIIAAHLVVSGIPYVTSACNIRFGSLVCPLQLSGETILPPPDHTAYFTGEHPCDKYGHPNKTYVNSEQRHVVAEGIVGRYYFSSKSDSSDTYYSKIKRYIGLLSAPAMSIDPGVTPRSFDYDAYAAESVFKYPDTNTARAGISNITRKIAGQKVAILGLGGTGAYLLDFICKTEVSEIHLFDADELNNHNAFRIPGALSIEELAQRPSKVGCLGNVYSKMRNGIVQHEVFVDEANVAELTGFDFVFMAIDNPKAKATIVKHLVDEKIPFVDLGMGLSLVDESIRGTLRNTLVTSNNTSHLPQIQTEDGNVKDPYAQNIQISELNALNAIMGVIAWKKLNGFYLYDEIPYYSTFIIDEGVMHSEA